MSRLTAEHGHGPRKPSRLGPASRFSIAFVGASTVTIGMFLGMSEIADRFRERDPTRYYSITDFIPLAGRQRPRLADTPERRPDNPEFQFERTVPDQHYERPSVAEPDLPAAEVIQGVPALQPVEN